MICRGGPTVTALGGGHGLAATLRAARLYAGDVTAVVSTADDGGSSGVLRRSLGTVPPGDLRKCLVALGNPGSVWAAAFEYRFAGPVEPSSSAGIDGHALGNLVISGLADVLGGLPAALTEAGRLLGAEGRVLPATVDPVVLRAETEGRLIEGQAEASRSGKITHVALAPPDVTVATEVVDAVDSADQVLLGPGSLFTSVLAVAVLPAVHDALKRARARTVYVCNLRPQVPETEGFDVAAHVRTLHDHGVDPAVVLCDTTRMAAGMLEGLEVLDLPLAGPDGGHDPDRLAAALRGLL